MLRKCPVCEQALTPLEIFKPGFFKSAGPVVCKNCQSTISPPWSDFSWFGFLGFGLVGLMIKFTSMEDLGVDSKFYYYFIILTIAVAVVFIPLYFFFPLDKKYSEKDEVT